MAAFLLWYTAWEKHLPCPHYMFHKQSTLTVSGLTFVSQKTEGLLQSYAADEVKLFDSIYGVKTRRVQGEGEL